MQEFCNQLNGSAAVGSELWNENKGIRKDSTQFLQNQFSISEASTGAVSTPNSIPSSVIFSSNYCGVEGATDNFDNASHLIYNTAHLNDSLSSSQASVPAESASHGVGASIVSRGLNLDYDSSQHSNSQSAQFSPIAGQSHSASSPNERVDLSAMWNVANTCEGTQGSLSKSHNQIPHQGAKSTHSETRAGNSSLQQASSVSESLNNCHSNTAEMQTNVQKKMDSSLRYNNNNDTTTSSHSTNSGTGFMSSNGNNVYRNSIGCGNGVHSSNSLQMLNLGANNESNSQNTSFGAPYNSANSRTKNQPGNCEPNCNSAFSGWQGLNTSTTSVSASNGWLIPNSLSSRNAHDISASSKEGMPKDGDENMVVDNEMSYSDLIGSAAGTENGEDKSQVPNGGQGNMSWGMASRLSMLGNDSSMNPGSSMWNNSQGPVTSSGQNTWDNSRQNSAAAASEAAEESSDMMDSQSGYSRLIGAIGGSDYVEGKQESNNGNFKQNTSRPLPPRIGLLGGGESSLNTASAGWSNSGPSGTSSSGWVGAGPRSNNGASDMTGNNGSGMSPPKPHNSWAQAAGKGLVQSQPSSSGSNVHNIPLSPDTRAPVPDNPSAPKAQSDSISEIKVKAAISEGWGQTPVNQDAPWDLPPSPPCSVDPSAMKDPPPTPVWRAPVNNGTEIWENNLRMNKGAPAPATSTAPPWGHTPATNIGGHWGDDDSSNNMWNAPAPPPNVASNPNWPEPNINIPNTMWGNPNAPTVPDKHWSGGSNSSQAGNTWNDPMVGSENGSAVWNPPVAKQRNVGSWSPASTPKKEMPPSGWELPSPPTNRRPPVSNYDDGTSVWGNPQRQGKVSHWKDMPSAKPIMNSGNNLGNSSGMQSMGGGGMQPPGPGMIRLPSGASMNSKNDMGAMWNKPSMNRNPGWQDMSSHDGPNIGTWGDDNMHMGNSMKNMSGNANVGGGSFNGGNGWGEQQNNSMSGYWSGNNKSKNNSNWADGQVDTSSWLGPSKQGGKPLTRDLIWASKQFRLLIEMGFKKEDTENSLRNNNMNFDDALVELRAAASMDGSMMDVDGFHGRKVRPATMQEDMSMSDNMLDMNFSGGNFHGSGFQSGGNFQGIGNVGTFKQMKGPNNASSLLNNALGGPQSTPIGNFTPLFQKLLQQQSHTTPNSIQQFVSNMQQLSNQSSRSGGNFPSPAHLRHLVQQIQMAVHAGHLNPQILHQALAPQTLQLLYQLLQQIKVLHQLQTTPKSAMGGGLQLNVQITQTKQRIINLQNQINAQQAVFMKQQVSMQPAPLHTLQNSNDIFKPNMESIPSLHNDFRDLSLKDVPLQGHQQSRLTQWKLPPSYDKDESQLCMPSNDFSRAPGPLPSKTSSASSSGPNLHPLLSQGDSAWSSLPRSQTESGWPEPVLSENPAGGNNIPVSAAIPSSLAVGSSSGNANSGSLDSKEPPITPPSSGPSTSSASHSSYNLTDLVPEFEPGKPWKGTQLRNIEDDPHITPGSIARSPLSVNTIKDADLLWNSKSNSTATSGTNDSTGGSLVSNTWIFSQPNTNNNSSGLNNKSGNSKLNWSTNESNTGSDMWGMKPRGPPPGISSQGWDKQGPSNSTFLLLRNLTPQIDGSTLRTLCMQHGPLTMFHLSLNHGIALLSYATKEEVSKAQSALNNCVLGNTTILADIPNETEIQQYLVLLCNQNTPSGYFSSWSGSQQGGSSSSSGGGGGGGGNNSTRAANNNVTMSTYPFGLPSGNSAAKQQDSAGWSRNMPSQLWPTPSNTLWGLPPPISDHDSSTNASLNRFLPDDLLGGESM